MLEYYFLPHPYHIEDEVRIDGEISRYEFFINESLKIEENSDLIFWYHYSIDDDQICIKLDGSSNCYFFEFLNNGTRILLSMISDGEYQEYIELIT